MLVDILVEDLHKLDQNRKGLKFSDSDDARKTIYVTIIKVAGEHSIAGQCMFISM